MVASLKLPDKKDSEHGARSAGIWQKQIENWAIEMPLAENLMDDDDALKTASSLSSSSLVTSVNLFWLLRVQLYIGTNIQIKSFCCIKHWHLDNPSRVLICLICWSVSAGRRRAQNKTSNPRHNSCPETSSINAAPLFSVKL